MPPSTSNTARRRESVLDAAEHAFGTRGYAGTTVEDIAAEAEVAKGLVFRYWQGKDDLHSEVLFRVSERHRGWHEHAESSPDFATSPIRETVRASISFFDRYPHVSALFNPVLSEPLPETAQPELSSLRPILTRTTEVIAGPRGGKIHVLLDALVVGTLRGSLGIADVAAHGSEIRTHIVTAFLEGGFEAQRPTDPDPGRRPRVRRHKQESPTGRLTREARRVQLLEAALDEFSANGYDRTRMEDIAERAGVSTAMLFKHWEGKEALFGDVQAWAVTPIAEAMWEASEVPGTIAEVLAAVGRAYVRSHYANPRAQSVLLPVTSLPASAQWDAGMSVMVNRAAREPEIVAALPWLNFITSMIAGAGRAAVLTMHRNALHPEPVAEILANWLIGGLDRVAPVVGTTLPGSSSALGK